MTDKRSNFTGSIPEYYDACLGPAWFDAYANDLANRLPADPDGNVLEIACGTGLLTRAVRERLDPALFGDICRPGSTTATTHDHDGHHRTHWSYRYYYHDHHHND